MAIKLTLYSEAVAAGFPSPAEDYREDALSLDEHLITHPAATYLAKASGDSMQGVGIFLLRSFLTITKQCHTY